MPQRIQLSRRKGWKMPENTVKVARPTKWGNPFRITEESERAAMVDHYRRWITREVSTVGGFADLLRGEPPRVTEIIAELRGKNLACFCRLDQKCHADVLLAIANTPAPGIEAPSEGGECTGASFGPGSRPTDEALRSSPPSAASIPSRKE